MPQYTVQNDLDNKPSYILRTDDDGQVWCIPTDPANSDYQAYLASLEAPQATQAQTQE